MPREARGERMALERGLPEAIREEKLVLGSILLDDGCYESIASSLKPEHLSLEAHQTIYHAIVELKTAGDRADRITLANLLMSRDKLNSVGGLTYLNSLDEGMPKLPNLSGYVRVIRDKADLRALIAASQVLQNSALIGSESPEKIAQQAALNISQISSGMVAAKTSRTFSEAVEAAGGLQDFLSPRTECTPTGFPHLDEIIYGLQAGLLYIIAGDSSDGKSALVGNIALNVGFGVTNTEWPGDPTPVGIFSLEMPDDSIYTRMLCSRAKVSSHKLKRGWLTAEERRALQFSAGEMSSVPIHIDQTSGLGVGEFCSRVRRMKREFGIKIAFLDYLQMLDWRADGMKSEYEGVTFASYSLQRLAKDEKIAVVALSQFHQEYSRRKDKTQRPTVDSCHGGGSIKKHADGVILMYRRSQEFPKIPDEKNRFEFIVGKQRDGRRGLVIVDFKGSWTTFVEAPEEVQPQRDDKE